MAIFFSEIPFHLQHDIAEKMDFGDFRNFELCSKYSSTSFTNVRHLIETQNVHVGQSETCFLLERLGIVYNCNAMIQRQNAPRFVVSEVYVQGASSRSLAALIRLVHEGHIIPGKKTLLNWNTTNEVETDVFRQLLEVFNVKEFYGQHTLDMDFCRLPVFRELEEVTLNYSFVPVDVLLQLQAPTIPWIELSSPLESSLNLFFQQWYLNDRKINQLGVFAKNGESANLEVLFDRLPYTPLWSMCSHSTSILSDIPLMDLGSRFEFRRFFLIENYGKKLLVTIERYAIRAGEIVDEKQTLWELLPPNIFHQVSGYCKCCRNYECACKV